MKAIFKVSGYLKIPGKTTLFAHHQKEIDIDARTSSLEMTVMASLRPRFSFKDTMMIDYYEKEIVLEDEIDTAEKWSHFLAILNVKEFSKLDLSKLRIADAFVGEFSTHFAQTLKTNFTVQEIKMPLGASKDKQIDAYLTRNKAMTKLMPWYSNPLKNSSPLKLTVTFLGLAFVGSWIGLGVVSMFALTSLYVLGAHAFSHQKERDLQMAWISDQRQEGAEYVEAQVRALGEHSRDNWKSYGETFIPSEETLAASYTHYHPYLAGAIAAEMGKIKAPAPREEAVALVDERERPDL